MSAGGQEEPGLAAAGTAAIAAGTTGIAAATGSLTLDRLEQLREEFYSEDKNRLAMNVCSRSDPIEACLTRKCLEGRSHIFNHKVEPEVKPVTNQKRSGRCWIFASLNVIRQPFVKQFNLEDFEFSQAYLFYWDKIERVNHFLHNMVLTARRGEEVTSRTVSYLLHDPINDGGQWDMLVNLVTKYGLMPKKCFPESFSCESSTRLNSILKTKLRQYTRTIRLEIEEGKTDAELEQTISEMMKEFYRIVGICLGIPPKTFVWQYTDKSKQVHSVGPISPLEFYNQHVKPLYNVEEKICLVSDPRPTNPYGRTYSVDCLGNMVGGRIMIYNNQPIDTLIHLARTSILSNEAVWFGCEVAKRIVPQQGHLDPEAHDYKLVFGTDLQLGLDKASRLIYGDTIMTHAMILTGCHVEEDGSVSRWRVENSWGEDRGEKGYLLMTTQWFKEFVFEIVVDKKFVSEEVLRVQNMEPVVLPAWDPLGALAQ
eukprot:TRINITY_DN5442_c1_g1_i4.p1 TRINITY_DN5442_c1_g1~~TRINITY_DN5442_c1_g1_i4.p1  ORF type:complete len:482 (+),score=81.15 TRINITY_DN5442_c1_g1_i4:18-1463(+)